MKGLELQSIVKIGSIGDKTICNIVAVDETQKYIIQFKFRSIYDEHFQKAFQRIIPVRVVKQAPPGVLPSGQNIPDTKVPQ
jgi:hypothetical protein